MASSLNDLYHESNFHSLNSLTTIYGLTSISGLGGSDMLLLATLEGKILSYDVKKPGSSLTKPDREVSFTYIPVDASVTAIDCFTCGRRGLIMAVAFHKDANGKSTNYLNIYCDYAYDPCDESKPANLEAVVENCRSFELDFVSYQLTHCKSKRKHDSSEYKDMLRTVFILLGGDHRIHVYSQEEDQGEFLEQALDNYFPELKNLPSVPMWVDMKISSDERRRVSAVGHASGDVSLFVTDLSTDEWKVTSRNLQHDSPIPCVRLFTKHSTVEMPGFMKKKFTAQTQSSREDFHLLVASSRETAVVYCFCEDQGFDLPVLLENSAGHDCVTCCAVADVDRDGENDIVIGTYGQELLVYKFTEPSLEIGAAYDPYSPCAISPTWTRSFSFPIVNMRVLDVNGDGLDEIVVVSARGLHILQCDMKMAMTECVKKLEVLRSMKIK